MLRLCSFGNNGESVIPHLCYVQICYPQRIRLNTVMSKPRDLDYEECLRGEERGVRRKYSPLSFSKQQTQRKIPPVLRLERLSSNSSPINHPHSKTQSFTASVLNPDFNSKDKSDRHCTFSARVFTVREADLSNHRDGRSGKQWVPRPKPEGLKAFDEGRHQ
ncbi:hypothetical protein BaRGS_00038337 [Batillaria attramentaria]|uniref:Uncharacterized protein n=1 Tax=Batillaria attramentaria TaxID=370345 RepID=A0ABD0J7L5_9CAEN